MVYSAASAVRNGMLYIGDQAGKFFALDLKTGKEKWNYEAAGQIYGANFYQDHVLFGAQDGTLHCLTQETGKLVWKFQIEDQIRCSPSIVQGRAFLVGCDGKLHIIDVTQGKEVGAIPLDAPAGTTAAASGKLMFFGTSSGEFLAVNWEKPEKIWSYQDRGRQKAISGSAALTDAAVFVPGEDRTLRAFDPATGKELWKASFKAKFESSPVVVGERIYIGGHDGFLDRVEYRDWQERMVL